LFYFKLGVSISEALMIAAQLRTTASSGNFLHIVQHGLYFTVVVAYLVGYTNLGFFKDHICSLTVVGNGLWEDVNGFEA
jgi:hypothetical protein